MGKNTLYFKLLLGFILIIACMIVLSSISLTLIKTIKRDSNSIQEAYMPLVSSTHRVEAYVNEAIENVKDYFYFNDDKYITAGIDTLEKSRKIAWDLLIFTSEHKELASYEPRLERLNQHILTYTRSIDKSVFAQSELLQAREKLQANLLSVNILLKELIAQDSNQAANQEIQKIILLQNDLIYILIELNQELSEVKSKQNLDFSSLQELLSNFESIFHTLQGEILLYFKTQDKETVDKIDEINTKIRIILADITTFFEVYKNFTLTVKQRIENSNDLSLCIRDIITSGIDITSKISKQVTNDIIKTNFSIIFGSLLVTLISILIAVIFANYIFRPIKRCLEYAQKISNGDLSKTLIYNKNNEVGDMIKAINKMVDSLKEKIENYERADQELNTKSNELYNILQYLPCTINVKNLQDQYTMVNKSFLFGLNKSEEEVLGQNNSIWNSTDLLNVQSIYEQAMLKSKESVTFEHVVTFYDNSDHYYITNKIPLLNHQGEIYSILTCSIEYTKEKILEQELVKSKNLSEMALVLAKAWHWHILPNEPDIYYTSSDMSKFYGDGKKKKDIFTSEEWFEDIVAYNSEQADFIRSNVLKVIWGELESYDYIYKFYNQSQGKTTWFREIVRRVYDNDSSELLLISGLSQDISEYKEQEIELVRSKDEAIAATEAKSEFLANMSHEIRTPLNAIIGMTYLATQKNLNKELENYLNKISISAKILLELINSILDFSKIEAGKLELEQTPIIIGDVLQKIINIVDMEAQKKELTLILNIDPAIPKVLLGDPLRLTQIILNLMNNAIKFSTSHTQIKLTSQFVEKENGKILLIFSVQDQGVGIAKEKVNCLFEAFKQADNSVTRKYGGTGLGLAICKQLIELMNGKILVESTENEGSLFTFTAYFDEAEEGETAYLEDNSNNCYDFNKTNILLAEDNLINQEIALELLNKLNFVVSLANNGQETLDILEKDYDEKQFALVLMDIQMPVLDGISTTNIIRQKEKYKNLPIIAMTAHALNSDRKKSLQAGMQAHITKPIEFDVLAKVLTKWLVPEYQERKDT